METIDGTYVGVSLSHETVNKLLEYIEENNIPNPLRADDFHCTLVYSTTPMPDFIPDENINPPYEGKVTKLVKWPSQPDADGIVSICLVLLFDCVGLTERHNEILDEHSGEHSFDDYTPHITLSYDVGNMQVDSLTEITDTIDYVEIIREYKDTLHIGWAHK